MLSIMELLNITEFEFPTTETLSIMELLNIITNLPNFNSPQLKRFRLWSYSILPLIYRILNPHNWNSFDYGVIQYYY